MSTIQFELKASALRGIQQMRLALAVLAALAGGLLLAEGAPIGWVALGVAICFAIYAVWRLRGLKNPHLIIGERSIVFHDFFATSHRSISTDRISIVEWRARPRHGSVSIAGATTLPIVIVSSWFASISEFHRFIDAVSQQLGYERVVNRHVAQPFPARVGLAAVTLLIAIHVVRVATNGAPTPSSLVATGAFVPTLFAQGEWYRLFTDALLHANWFHLLMNGMLIAFGFMELENKIGSARVGILMFEGALAASISTWLFSSHAIVIGASGMAYAAVGAIAYQLARSQELAPLSLRLHSRQLLLVILLASITVDILSESVSFAMHAGGFVAGVIGMAALTPTLKSPSKRTRLIVNSIASICLSIFLGSVFELLRYRAGDHPSHLMLTRLLAPDSPPALVNMAAYQLAMNSGSSASELEAARRASERILSARDIPAEYVSSTRDTAAVVNYRLGNAQRARDLEVLALADLTATPGDTASNTATDTVSDDDKKQRRAQVAQFSARVATFELAAARATAASRPVDAADVTAVTAKAHLLCVSPATIAAGIALHAVVLRANTPVGLLLVPDTRRLATPCIQAPSARANDRIEVTYRGPAQSSEHARYFSFKSGAADLPSANVAARS